MIRKCYLLMVMLAMSVSSRGQHANVQNSVVGVSTGSLIKNGSGSVSSTMDTVGDPSFFGTNTWNVYAWNATGSDSWILNYAGYYVDTNLSMNTLNYWDENFSPSYAPDYFGDPITVENYSFSAKRRGFPFGSYRINIPFHNDYAYLLIDGVEVWNHEGCCDNHDDVWQGFLCDTSKIEFKVMEFSGGSNGMIQLIKIPIYISANFTFISCFNGTTDVTINATGGVPPFTGIGIYSEVAGSHDYTVYDSLGDSATITLFIAAPSIPDSVITTNISPTFCEGDTVILTGPSHGTALSFNAPNRVLIPINSPETNYTYELDFKTTQPYTGISSVRDGDLGGSVDRVLYLEEGEIAHHLYSNEIIISSGENYADGQWHHVAVVVESGVGQNIFVDGILVASGSLDHSDFSWDNTINLGYGENWFEGSIDNVRLWNLVRTPSEIAQDQTAHFTGSFPGLIGNWNFDDFNGSITYNTIDNSEAYLMDSPSITENNTNTYAWNNGETSRTITATTAGNFIVAIANINGCPVNSPSIDLFVRTLPLTPVISASSALLFCEGGQAELNCNSTESIQWNKDGSPIIGSTSVNLYTSTEGNYSVTVTNSNGCSNTSVPQFLAVHPIPPAPIVIAASPLSFCEGGNVLLSVQTEKVNVRWASSVIAYSSEYSSDGWGSIQTLGPANTYPQYGDIPSSWASADPDGPDEFIELEYTLPIAINFIDIYETYKPGTIDTVSVKNPGTGLFEPVYTATPQSAGDSSRILHITFPMTTFPVSEIRISMDMSTVPDWNEIDAVQIGNDLPSNYLWTNGDTMPTFIASSTGSYTVTIANSVGCTSTSLPVNVFENLNPVVTCGPDMYSSECNSSYILSGGLPSGGGYSGTGVQNGIFNPSIGAGIYNIKYIYTDNNGCKETSTAFMTVVPIPVTTLNPFSNVCSNASSFALTGGTPLGGVYQGAGIMNGIFNPTVGAGLYAINYLYTDSLGCSTSSMQNITVDICTGISQINSQETALIFPNPANDKVKIKFDSNERINSLEIYNSSGAIVFSKMSDDINSQKPFEVDLHQYAAGIYVLRIHSEYGIVFKKLMIE